MKYTNSLHPQKQTHIDIPFFLSTYAIPQHFVSLGDSQRVQSTERLQSPRQPNICVRWQLGDESGPESIWYIIGL